MSLENLSRNLRRLHGIETIGFTASCFDLLHAGHVLMLQEAKEKCDKLIVALQVNPNIDRPEKRKPFQSLYERYLQLKPFADEIIPYETEEELLNILATQKIHIRIVGEDYKDKDFTGRKFCEENGIQIYYNKRKHNFSTTNLVNSIK